MSHPCTRGHATKLREAALKALHRPHLRARLEELGQEVGQPRTSDELSASLRKDFERGGAVLTSVNYKPE